MKKVASAPSLPLNVYLGVDPGASGGFALIGPDGSAEALPVANRTLPQLWEWFEARGLGSRIARCYAAIEKVGGYVRPGGPGIGPNIGSAMFQFGAWFGALRAFLIAARIPYEEVAPVTWQRALAIPQREPGEPKGSHKKKLRDEAARLFPAAKITMATCDALLIAEYLRRKKAGIL